LENRRTFLKFILLMTVSWLVSVTLLAFSKLKTVFPSLEAESRLKGELTVEEKISLPEPKLKSDVSVEEAIYRRRSIRRYSEKPLRLQDLSNLLWAAQGITDPINKFRASPSAGATYPLEMYLVVKRGGVEELTEGVYHYDPYTHTLERISDIDVSEDLYYAAVSQRWVREAPVNIVIACVYERTTLRYGERGVRYVHMEAGHAAENLYLQAVSLGLGMVVVGAFLDGDIQKLLGLPENFKPLYIIPVGRLK